MKYYIIYKKYNGDGFFAKFNHVLMHLYIADSMNLIPYVDFQNYKSNLYDETNKEILNEWEYCFEQKNTIDEIYNSEHIMSNGQFVEYILPAQGKNFRDKELVKKFNGLIEKYVKIKPEILSKINPELKQFKTLGVHCRRSDMVKDHPEIGLNYSNETFFKKINKIFNEGGFEKIYLATEEFELLNYLKLKFGDKLLYQNCFRIIGNQSPVFYLDPRPLHRTLQCQEVLLDALNMSNCDSLLCGISGVSNGTIYINGLKFKDVYYFDEINL